MKIDNIILLMLLLLFNMACADSDDPGKQAGITDEVAVGQDTAPGKKRTQAILKIQPTTFDPDHKEQLSEAYQVVTQISVPANLVPQNKWFMFEGPVLENNKIAYRYYADARHRFDIFGKTVEGLIMDTVGWHYHDIMDWGSDILKVGNSLGMGSPGIWYQDSVYTFSEWANKDIEIIEQGKETSAIRTTFKGLTIDEQSFDLVQDWRISAGDYHTEISLEVIGGELPQGMQFATGIVKHLDSILVGEANGYQYAMNFGHQSYHEELMGMGVVAQQKYGPRIAEDELNYLMIFENATKAVSYRFLAGWERDQSGVKSIADFQQLVTAACR